MVNYIVTKGNFSQKGTEADFMIAITPARKLLYSVLCAFAFILYVPLACAVGSDTARDTVRAGEIETSEECLCEEGESCCFCIENGNFA